MSAVLVTGPTVTQEIAAFFPSSVGLAHKTIIE